MTRAIDPPVALDLQPQRLRLRWPEGEAAVTAQALRQACRCAECRAAALEGRARPPRADLRLTGAAPVGQYALQLVFSDGHRRGIYPWSLLRELSAAHPQAGAPGA